MAGVNALLEQIYDATTARALDWPGLRKLGDNMQGLRRVVYLCVCLMMYGVSVEAMQGSAAVTITVIDQTGAIIPGAKVQLSSLESEDIYRAEADRDGKALLMVKSGSYGVAVTSPGFMRGTRRIYAGSQETNSKEIVLTVGWGSGPVAVSSERVELALESYSPGSQGDDTILPSRPIPSGLAPGMKVRLVGESNGEKTYAVIFHKGDEILSGLTDFAMKQHVSDAHFTGIGAVSSAVVGWLDLSKKLYHRIDVKEQVEVLSMMGDIAMFNGKPVVHAHMVFGKQDGATVGGHLWEAYVNPTVEVFVTTHTVKLEKVPDDASGMKLIDPTK